MYADKVIFAGRIYDFLNPDEPLNAVAIRRDEILQVASNWSDLDKWVGPETHVVRDPQLTLVPAFFDTHNHMYPTSNDLHNVDLDDCRSMEEVVDVLRQRAESRPKGEWIVSSRRWHESSLKEERLPYAAELDKASTDHPILLRRGGHVGVANSLALELAGITADSEDPTAGTVERDSSGKPLGPLIEQPAYFPVFRLIPAPSMEQQVQSLIETCRLYNSRGIGAIRETGVEEPWMEVYKEAHRRGGLTVRSNVMYRVDSSKDLDYRLKQLDEFRTPPGWGDDVLKVEGVKFVTDGGVEAGWMSNCYANDDAFFGHNITDEDSLFRLIKKAHQLGWKVGTHAVGDLAVRAVVNAYERLIRAQEVKSGDLVMEHGFLADRETRSRTIKLGIPVTVQHPLIYALGKNMLKYWGEERTREVMPVKQWLNEGAVLAGGSDCNVAPLDPLLAIWGFVTRGSLNAGIQGPEHAVDRVTAFRLYTYDGAALVGEAHRRGRPRSGYLADLVGYGRNPIECDIDDLPDLSPKFTLIGGNAVYDPNGIFDDVGT